MPCGKPLPPPATSTILSNFSKPKETRLAETLTAEATNAGLSKGLKIFILSSAIPARAPKSRARAENTT
ncbi:MAG: hypothetical protein A2538_02390 [Candidatus Magasanikbacteria bacterium RIFOXYD2_FULL_41_14]|uniref:Uncharacterized protein n=1 Tax=Candidatus Magasanikbacteria bacterium RIFOXYD2_FULL_41_14 TaxID=1798709 RepID=A0A1F6PCL4_9BACT|nr:MAG: hypothetical protein A2538_02390 [Candidatus Magasanikbacteria bacterium RIFOXYD2_FULL_41_14]